MTRVAANGTHEVHGGAEICAAAGVDGNKAFAVVMVLDQVAQLES